MKWVKVVGLIGVLTLFISPVCRPDETITITLDDTPKSKTVEVNKPTSVPKKKSSGNTSAQSAVMAQSKAIGRLGVVSERGGKIYASRNEQSRLYYNCPAGTYLAVTDTQNSWYGILMADGRTGWIRASCVKVLNYTLVPDIGSPTARGRQVVQTALRYLGVPYVWGGNTPRGIDCSGFVRMVFAANGVHLPRTAREQVNVGYAVNGSQIQPGDRLYFCCKGRMVDHTGIYIGNSLFIHSSGSRGGVGIDNIFRKKYYNSLVAIRRS